MKDVAWQDLCRPAQAEEHDMQVPWSYIPCTQPVQTNLLISTSLTHHPVASEVAVSTISWAKKMVKEFELLQL